MFPVIRAQGLRSLLWPYIIATLSSSSSSPVFKVIRLGCSFPEITPPRGLNLGDCQATSYKEVLPKSATLGDAASASRPRPSSPPAAAKPRRADHAGRSRSGHAQWPGRWGRRGTPGPAWSRGAGAGRGKWAGAEGRVAKVAGGRGALGRWEPARAGPG